MLPAEKLTKQVIGRAIELHRHTGQDLLESVYEPAQSGERSNVGHRLPCHCEERSDAAIPCARRRCRNGEPSCAGDCRVTSLLAMTGGCALLPWATQVAVHPIALVYEQCLCHQLAYLFARQVVIPAVYKAVPINQRFSADIVVACQVILEIKAIAAILPAHEAQLQTGPTWPRLTRPSERAASASA